MIKRLNIILKATVIISAILSISSCGNRSHENFQKRKYLKLKNHSEYSENTESTEDETEVEFETIEFTKAEDNVWIENENIETFLASTSEIPENENIQANESDEKIEKTVVPNHKKKEPRNFNSLSKEEQKRAIVDFNRIFNNGLGIFISSLVSIGLGSWMLFTLNGVILGPGVAILVIGLALLFIAWVTSMVAVYKVKKLKLADVENQRLRAKISLARLMAYIGILVCIGTITPGIILLILWLRNII